MAQQQGRTFFVGREPELQELTKALVEVSSGRGRLILLGGEPGIGKSRLADELATWARERGHQVLWGRGWEDAGAPAYWPWVQALRTYLRSTDPAEVRRHLGSGASDVAQMLPELHDLFADLPALPDRASDSARFQLFDSIATFLRTAARSQPLLIVLDDLQAADTPSILLLRFLAGQLGDMSVLMLGTYRDIELTPEHPLTVALAELAREPLTRVYALAGLGVDAVSQFVQTTASRASRDHLAAAIWRETSGNPLFVGEAIRLLTAEGRLNDVADLSSLRLAVPAGVHAVIARRIGLLSEAAGRALGLGAALGPEFSLEVLRRIGGFEADEALDLIDEAVRAGLLVAVAGASGRVRFSHDLVRETLEDELSAGPRARLHRRIGTVLEDMFATSIDAHLAELAFHFVEAARGEESGAAGDGVERAGPKAIDYARRAGDMAARSLAYEEADRHYRMALACLDLTIAPDERGRSEILVALGESLARAGDLEAARATYLKAADAARRIGAAEPFGLAAVGYGGRLQWARAGKDAILVPLLQEAIVMLGGGDMRLRVQLLTRLACAWRSSPDRQSESGSLSRQAVELARELNDPATLSYALAGRYWAILWPGNPADRHPIASEMLALADALGDGERLIDTHLMQFQVHSEMGQMAEARADVDTVTRLADELRQPAQRWLGVAPRTLLALMAGDYPLAETLAETLVREETDSRIQTGDARDNLSASRMHLFLLRREQGRVAEEEGRVRASIEDFPWYPLHRAALACLLLDIGRADESRAVFENLARDQFSALYRDSEWLLGISLASEACFLLEDASAAATLYAQLAPFAGRHAIGHAEGSLGAVDRYLGLLAATLDHLDDAVSHLAAAVKINANWGAPPWAAHSRHDLAGILRRRDAPGDRARADQLDREALTTARAIGMKLAEQIEALDNAPASVPHAAAWLVASGTFRREGEYWTVEFGRDTFRVRDTKGMGHLARLLETPGREVHALELAGSASSPRDASAGPVLDSEAKAAYRERLAAIRAERSEAESWNDPERVARLQAEEEALVHELAGALGLHGRDRSLGSPAERARVSVTRAIRGAMVRIAEHGPGLGDHLEATIRTGTFCSYTPDPRAPITWRR